MVQTRSGKEVGSCCSLFGWDFSQFSCLLNESRSEDRAARRPRESPESQVLGILLHLISETIAESILSLGGDSERANRGGIAAG